MIDTELARLEDLRRHHDDGKGHLLDWLDYKIEELQRRLIWLGNFQTSL